MKKKIFFASFLVLLFLEFFNAFIFRGKTFWWFSVFSILILAASLLWSLGLPLKKWISTELVTHSSYLVLPIIFYSASLVFLLLIQSSFLRQVFILGNTLLFLAILAGIRGVILNLEYKIKPRLTYNILALSTLITSFLVYSIIWALFKDLGLSIWFILVIFFLLTGLLLYQIFHLSGILIRRSITYALFAALVVTEVSWILCFWPIEYFFSSILLTVVFYALWGLTHHQLENTLTSKLVVEYLLIGVIVFFLFLKNSLANLGL